MFTGPVGPVEIFFDWSKVVLGNFYLPSGLLLASSPGPFFLGRPKYNILVTTMNLYLLIQKRHFLMLCHSPE